MGNFQVNLSRCQPCWYCQHFEGMLYENTAAACNLPKGPRVRSSPENGCSGFVRVPGVDDEEIRFGKAE